MVTIVKDPGKTDQVRALKVPVIDLLLLSLESNTKPSILTHSRSYLSYIPYRIKLEVGVSK